ncbi:hypothetical protein HY573_00560 [Candidatus Parcubacteria bacterium]|nr:hypothetical protein [Candidatus Parcubacteria bacterium]MBI4385304.1 hypothetical protein [Candidatus Parcubacteria bacterium]
MRLLRKWHWKENLKHRDIASRLKIPRSTVTRWFHYFNIPTQPGSRFTNLNLLNMGPRKTPPAKPKTSKPRPWKVREEFFETWTGEMAYILGFFCADGTLTVNPRGSRYLALQISDRGLLLKIKACFGIGHKLSLKRHRTANWKDAWRIQIGSKRIFNRFIELGITPQKAYRLRMPVVPKEYAADFIRGYFDGDGGAWFGYVHKNDRKMPTKALVTTFTSCSNGMLMDVALMLSRLAGVRLKQPRFSGKAFRIFYSTWDSRKIYQFIYHTKTNLYLARKKVVFEKYLGT